VSRKATEASSNGRTADFGSAHEGSNPSASASLLRPAGGGLEARAALPSQVVLAGLGTLPPRVLGEVAQGLRQVLGVGWKPAPPLDRPAYAFNEARGQYHAPAILRRLSAFRGGQAERAPRAPIIALLDGDLFLPDDGEFVLSDADRAAGTGVLALVRLAGDPAVLRHRLLVEALQLLGHLAGLPGCLDHRCAMFTSRDATDADRKGPGLCAGCRAALGAP
jgi:archaemetzincin